MEGSADIRNGLEEVSQELQHVERQIERLLQKQQRLQQRKEQLELQSSRLQELSLETGSADWDRSDYPWSAKLKSLCETVFGIKKYRTLQEKTMNASLSGRDVILLMPTGGGKSLCYQLPALASKGFTLVVSPLVSLMEDQTMTLEELGINAAALNSNTTPESVKDVHRQMTDGRSELKLLYVTPEKIAKSKRFMACLERAHKGRLLARIAIDEVHCCSQWGHDFRPDYKILGLLKRQFPDTPVLGLTATATMDVLDDVKSILGLQGCQIFRAGFNRPNLFYEVRRKPSKQADFLEELGRLVNTEFKDQSGIIYCFSRKDTENVAASLEKQGIRAHPYHAMLDAQYRSYVHKKWKENEIQVVVATVAFGMGIDKPDVRFVIHHSISKSMENYYQESGRAGRDDEPARCIVFYGLADVFRQSTMVVTEQTGQQKLYNMVAYCITPATCRRKLISQHFGERWDNTRDCDSMCDTCLSGVQLLEKDMTFHMERVYKILDRVALRDERVTALKLTEELLSKKGVAPLEKDAAKLSSADYEHLIAYALLEGYLREDFHFTPYTTISYIIPGPKARLLKQSQHTVTVPCKGQMSPEVIGLVSSSVKGQGASASGSRSKAVSTSTRESAKDAGKGGGGGGHHGKAKKRKLEESTSIIDLCSDDSSDDGDFVDERRGAGTTGENSEKGTAGKVAGASIPGESSAGKKPCTVASATQSKGKSSRETKTDATSGVASNSSQNVGIAQGSGSALCANVAKKLDKEREAAAAAASADTTATSGPFKFRARTSTQSLASSTPTSTAATTVGASTSSHGNQGPAKQSLHHPRPPGKSRPDASHPSAVVAGNDPRGEGEARGGMRQVSSSPRGAGVGTSPGSDIEAELRTVYTEQLLALGSDGESFHRENSSFTLSTSFSGSEDGTPVVAGRRRKATMRRVNSMDQCEEDEEMGDDFETLKKVYSAQMKKLDDSI